MKNLSLFSFFTLLIFTSMACEKVEYQPTQALLAGECEYVATGGMTETEATAEFERVTSILKNSTLGNSTVQINPRSKVYVSAVNKKDQTPDSYGIQVIFSCDEAALVSEKNSNFSSHSAAQAALDRRITLLSTTGNIKVVEQKIDDDNRKVCQKCTRDDGTRYDCNCKTDYDYFYKLVYFKVNTSNANTSAIISAYQTVSQAATLITGNENNLTDSLKVAKQILPTHSEANVRVQQWSKILQKLEKKN